MRKFAFNRRSAYTVKDRLCDADTTAVPSVQFTKAKPGLGFATRVTCEPLVKVPPPVIEPPDTGTAAALTVYVAGAKFAVSVRLADALNDRLGDCDKNVSASVQFTKM
jgi:hypothetical protein